MITTAADIELSARAHLVAKAIGHDLRNEPSYLDVDVFPSDREGGWRVQAETSDGTALIEIVYQAR